MGELTPQTVVELMYTEFFGLSEKPFNPVPNPRFVHWTEGHREALAQLEYGIEERRGFLILTGEVGTGKTTLVKALVERLPLSTAVSSLFHSSLSLGDILEVLLEDLGVQAWGDSEAQRMFALRHFLVEHGRRGGNTLLVVDEAQNLTAETLESIRLLSNLETESEKLLQILLVGQPELERTLRKTKLRQLEQRIGIRCRLRPLRPSEAMDFVRHRLSVAGATDLDIFTPEAVRRIGAYAHGVPRVMNAVCDHCLLIGYADDRKRVDVAMVDQSIDYLEGRREPEEEDWSVVWGGAEAESSSVGAVAMAAAPTEATVLAAGVGA